MQKTKIEWADMTWNPVTGCLHGCDYCYARRIAKRFGRAFGADDSVIGVTWSTKSDGTIHDLKEPVVDECKNRIAPFPFEFDPTFHRNRLDDLLRHQKKTQTIFVCNMADLFGNWVPEEWIETVFDTCKQAPWNRYMFLTKNPSRYGKLNAAGLLPKQRNFWYGITATNNQQAEAAFRHLPNVWDGYNLFLSAEPLYGEINIASLKIRPQLVIIGAETGNCKKKVVPCRSWIENTANNAKSIGAATFMKDSVLRIVGDENMLRELPWRCKYDF